MTDQNSLQIMKKETIDLVEARIKAFAQNGELHFPKNYSPQNALKAAWLIIQELKGSKRDGHRPALEICSRPSVANALLNMVVLGLNPAKKQCYFIVYGNQLTCQMSVFGTMARLRRMRPDVSEIIAETIHEGDEVLISINKGKKSIDSHKQKFGSADRPVVGAYCIVLDHDGEIMRSEVMTIEQIKQAWKQSKAKPFLDSGELNPDSTQAKFQTEMAKKTVINRCCKPWINSSDDSDLVINAINESDEIRTDAELAGEIASDANGELIDIDPGTGDPIETQAAEPDDGADLSVDYKKQLEKMANLDPESYKLAVERSGFDPKIGINEDGFKRISALFNEIIEGEETQEGQGPLADQAPAPGGTVQREF